MKEFFAALLMVSIVGYALLIIWGFVECVRSIGFFKAIGLFLGIAFLILFAAAIAIDVTGIRSGNPPAEHPLTFFGEVAGIGLVAFLFIARSGGFDFSEPKLKIAGITHGIAFVAAVIELIRALS